MNGQPLMQRALGPGWEKLAPAIRSHYRIPSASTDEIVVIGQLDVALSRWLRPVFKLAARFGALVDRPGRKIAVTVTKRCEAGDGRLFWDRVFVYPDGERKSFRSTMEVAGPGELIEFVKGRLGLRLQVSERDGDLIFLGEGYFVRFGPRLWRIPDCLCPGRSRIVEKALSKTGFAIDFRITHPLFGETFSYRGEFRLPESKDDVSGSCGLDPRGIES